MGHRCLSHLDPSLPSGQISASPCKESKHETQNNSYATFKTDRVGPFFIQVPAPAIMVAYPVTPKLSGIKQHLFSQILWVRNLGRAWKRACLCSVRTGPQLGRLESWAGMS